MEPLLSVFLSKNGEIVDEFYDVSWKDAYEIALNLLYKDGEFVPNVSVIIRDKDEIKFSATNPSKIHTWE